MIGHELRAGRLNGLIALSSNFAERLASDDTAGAQVIMTVAAAPRPRSLSNPERPADQKSKGLR
jgi:hypothetical protein